MEILNKMKATNIQWDIDLEDGKTYEDTVKAIGLPSELCIPNDVKTDDEISDYISDMTGFCHKGFLLEKS